MTRSLLLLAALALPADGAPQLKPKKPALAATGSPIEVRAELHVFYPSPIRQPSVWWYSVCVGRDKDRQDFRLDLPTEALSELAKEMNGAVVVVVGDLALGTGDGHHERVIRVTSLKRADAPKK